MSDSCPHGRDWLSYCATCERAGQSSVPAPASVEAGPSRGAVAPLAPEEQRVEQMRTLRDWAHDCADTSEATYKAKSNGDDYDQDIAPSFAARGRAFRECADKINGLLALPLPPQADAKAIPSPAPQAPPPEGNSDTGWLRDLLAVARRIDFMVPAPGTGEDTIAVQVDPNALSDALDSTTAQAVSEGQPSAASAASAPEEDDARRALRELVACKALKDKVDALNHERDRHAEWLAAFSEYKERKEKAWRQARLVLANPPGVSWHAPSDGAAPSPTPEGMTLGVERAAGGFFGTPTPEGIDAVLAAARAVRKMAAEIHAWCDEGIGSTPDWALARDLDQALLAAVDALDSTPQAQAWPPSAPDAIDAWIPTWKRLPDEEQVVEVAVLSGKHVRRGYGCRVDGGEGWTWALSHGGACENADDCEADDDYDVIAWREPSPLPEAPAVRRFKILRERGDGDGLEEVAIVTGREAAQAMMAEIGLAARWEELPPAGDLPDVDDAPDLTDTKPLPPPSWMGA